jgi:hypothetical protein
VACFPLQYSHMVVNGAFPCRGVHVVVCVVNAKRPGGGARGYFVSLPSALLLETYAPYSVVRGLIA